VAMLAREIFSSVRIFTFSNQLVEVASRRGFALSDAIRHSQNHGGTELGGALTAINSKVKYDRIIIITDEQQTDHIPMANPQGRGYVINVGTYENGVGYGRWTHINGWSEAVINYIKVYEDGPSSTKDYTKELELPKAKEPETPARVYGSRTKRMKTNAKSRDQKTGRNTRKRVQRARSIRKRK